MSADAAGNLLADASGAASIASTAGVLGTGGGRCEVGDVLWDRVAGADAGDADIRGFAGFAEGVVARVEVFALLCGEKRECVNRGCAGIRFDGRGEVGGWVRLERARLGEDIP